MLQKNDKRNVKQFINECTVLEVPKFQRDYAWGEEEIDDFVKDWSDLVTKHSSGHNTMDHFLGGVVTIKDTQNGETYKVVDGQQRLTTIFLATWKLKHAFARISHKAEEEKNDDVMNKANVARRVHDEYLFASLVNEQFQEIKQSRLIPSEKDRDYFIDLISDLSPNEKSAAHRRLREASQQIQEDIVDTVLGSDGDINDKFSTLSDFSNRLFNNCYVLHISSNDQEEAYRLFAVLNDRGKSLSDGDHLRWSSMDLIDSNSIAVTALNDVSNAWNEILAGEPSEIAKFLEAYYPSYTGRRAKKNSVAQEYRDEFFDYMRPLSNTAVNAVRDRVFDMREHVGIYRSLTEGSWPYDDPKASQWKQKRLERLVKDLKHTLCMPLLLSAIDKLPEDKFVEIVLLLERFVFRYITMVGAKPATLYPIYYAHAEMIRSQEQAYEVADLVVDLRKLVSENAKDAEFEEALRGGTLDLSPPKKLRVVRYFLTTMDAYCQWTKSGTRVLKKPREMMVIDSGQIHIEHIYPQKAQKGADDPDLEPLKNKLGNLTFWPPTDNIKASNKPFQVKREEYKKSDAQMTRSVAERHTKWTAKAIKGREEELIQAALKVFLV